jgi:hypothetical protein
MGSDTLFDAGFTRNAPGNLDDGPAGDKGCPTSFPGEKSRLTLLSAALALPGMLPAAALAQSAPDRTTLSLRYFDYRDWQPGAERMTVRSPSIYLLKPLSETVSLESTLVYDAMSGASPIAFDTLSGASGLGVTDYRSAGDVKVTRYFDRYAIGVGVAYSHERDYVSRAGALEVRTWTEDRNRTFAFGVSFANDHIHPAGGRSVDDGRKDTIDVLLGVTQVLNASAIVQSNLTYSTGHGYYSDPYKQGDARPGHRRTLAWLTRVNQYVPVVDATLKVAYRYIDDSFGDRSHMVEAEWHQPLPGEFALAPLVRYYTQGAADFYYGPPLGNGFVPGQPYTTDNRLSAYGAITLGATLERAFPDGITVDVSLSYYRQRPAWRVFGSGSDGVPPFSARWISVGVTRTY